MKDFCQSKKVSTIGDAERAIENQKGNINDEMDMVEINAYHQGLQDALEILRMLKAGLRERIKELGQIKTEYGEIRYDAEERIEAFRRVLKEPVWSCEACGFECKEHELPKSALPERCPKCHEAWPTFSEKEDEELRRGLGGEK